MDYKTAAAFTLRHRMFFNKGQLESSFEMFPVRGGLVNMKAFLDKIKSVDPAPGTIYSSISPSSPNKCAPSRARHSPAAVADQKCIPTRLRLSGAGVLARGCAAAPLMASMRSSCFPRNLAPRPHPNRRGALWPDRANRRDLHSVPAALAPRRPDAPPLRTGRTSPSRAYRRATRLTSSSPSPSTGACRPTRRSRAQTARCGSYPRASARATRPCTSG